MLQLYGDMAKKVIKQKEYETVLFALIHKEMLHDFGV